MQPKYAFELMKNRANKFTHEEKKDIHESDNQHIIDSYQAACDLAEKFQIKNLKMNFVEKEIEKALLKRDYTMYELACKYQ